LAKGGAEFYEANIERRPRATGLDERELIERGTRFGDRAIGLLERAVLQIYRRHREHVWTEHAINHVEEALEASGLQERVPKPPAICFVDLTGYTRLTEERGDEVAAHVAGRLAALVNDISRGRGGRPVRGLGGGGRFQLPGAAGAVGSGAWRPAGCATPRNGRGPSPPGSTWSSAPPRPACQPPTSASTPARSSSRTGTWTARRGTWPPGGPRR